MSRYESQVKTIYAAQANVYARLSDLSQLQTMKDLLTPEQKSMIKDKFDEVSKGKVTISDIAFTEDTASCTLQGMPVCVRIIDREPIKTIKFAADKSPVAATLWIQLIGIAPYETKVKVTLDVDIPFFLKPMVGSKLDGVADQIAEALTRIPY